MITETIKKPSKESVLQGRIDRLMAEISKLKEIAFICKSCSYSYPIAQKGNTGRCEECDREESLEKS